MNSKKLLIFFILLTGLIPTRLAEAAGLGTLSPPTGTTLDLNANVIRFVNFAIGSGTVVFLYMFVRGAIEWTISEGDKMRLETARNRMTQAAIGLLLLGTCFAIASIVRSLTYSRGF